MKVRSAVAMQIVELLYFGDVSSKIESAHRLHRKFGARLRADRQIRENLDRLIHLDQEVSDAIRSMGMSELCADCGSQPPGGCCSAMMANETDAMLLLINLSAGSDASPKRDDGDECRFLGPAGCSLKFKPFVCLNYLCWQIQSDSSSEQLARLQGATSEFLSQLLVVEELIQRQLAPE